MDWIVFAQGLGWAAGGLVWIRFSMFMGDLVPDKFGVATATMVFAFFLIGIPISAAVGLWGEAM